LVGVIFFVVILLVFFIRLFSEEEIGGYRAVRGVCV